MWHFCHAAEKLPAFYPTAEHSYGIKEGLPDMAVEKVFLDKTGRLNITTSGGPAFSKNLYEYYGGRAYPVDLELKGKIHGVSFQGIDSSGRIYGLQYNENDQSFALIYDPLNSTTKTIDIGKGGHALAAAEGALFALASQTQYSDTLEIYGRILEPGCLDYCVFRTQRGLAKVFHCHLSMGPPNGPFYHKPLQTSALER